MRDHIPVVIEEFNGFFKRGDLEACPFDHNSDCNNVMSTQAAIQTRDGVDTYNAMSGVVRMYEYNNGGETLLILNTNGDIFHYVPNVSLTWIMNIPGMTDFEIFVYFARAYITPSLNIQMGGMLNQYVWVYKGDGTPARLAAGAGPTGGTFSAANSATAGNVEAGYHVFGVAYETDTGFITAIGTVLAAVNATGALSVDLSNIPVSPDSFVVARRITASVAIDPTLYTGDMTQYQPFFLQRINDNVTTSLTVNFYDAQLILDASYLFNLYSKIPAGGGIGSYHGRMLVWNYQSTPSVKGSNTVCLVSQPGQPEAISQVSGLILIPPSDYGISQCQEYRDVLYIFRENQTFAGQDNGGNPSSWPIIVLDNGIGCAKHGIGIAGENGIINVEFLPIFNLSGVFIFNGTFTRPELTWKIEDFWCGITGLIGSGLDIETVLRLSECYHDTINQRFYINIPTLFMILMADYRMGLGQDTIKWWKWTFSGLTPTTMALITELNTLLIGSQT